MPADYQLFFRLTQQIKVPMNKFDLCVVGLDPELVKKTCWNRSGVTSHSRAASSAAGWLEHSKKIVVKREFSQLLCHGLFDSILAVAQVAAPQA